MRSNRSVTAAALLGVLAAGLLVLAGPGAQGQMASCPVSSGDQAIDDQEQQLLVLINQYRSANGIPTLSFQADVTRAAAWFSRDMATRNYFPANHVDSNGRTVPQRLTWCGARYSNWAENIFAGRSDAQSTFNAWRSSSGHNANMLRSGVSTVGIARAYSAGSRYGWYWTLDLTSGSTSSPTTVVSPTTTRPTTTTTRPPIVTTTAPPVTTSTVPTTATTVRPTTTTTPTGTPSCPPQFQALCDRIFGR